jgi:hypothetical protein
VLVRAQGTARAAHLYAQSARFVVVRWMSNRRVVNVQSSIAIGINVDGHRKSSASTLSRSKMGRDGWPAADGAHGDEGVHQPPI